MAVAKFEQKTVARKDLKCSAYKVLDYLVDKADVVGKAWPDFQTIQDECNLADKTVDSALTQLAEAGYIKYLRKAEKDPLTGYMQTNVYQIRPDYLLLSDAEEAVKLWESHPTVKITVYKNNIQKQKTKTILLNQTSLLSDYTVKLQALPLIDVIDSESIKDSENETDDLPLFKFEREISQGTQLFEELAAAGRNHEQTEPEVLDRPVQKSESRAFVDELAFWGIEPWQTRNLIAQHGPDVVAEAIDTVNATKDVKHPGRYFWGCIKNSSKQKAAESKSREFATAEAAYENYVGKSKYAWAIQA